MALSKNIMMSFGVEAAYHVLSAMHIYPEKPSAHIDVESYLSREGKETGWAPVEVHQFEFAGQEYPFANGVSIDAAYAAVKTREMFADAQEV